VNAYRRKTGAMLVAMAVSFVAAVAARAATSPYAPVASPEGAVASAPKTAGPDYAKVQPLLRQRLQEKRAGTTAATRVPVLGSEDPSAIMVVVRMLPGTDLGGLIAQPVLRRKLDGFDRQVVLGKIPLAQFEKLIALEGVERVESIESTLIRPAPPEMEGAKPPDLARARQRLRDCLATYGARPCKATPQPKGDWFEVTTNIHKSQAAWGKGYTGAGVHVMVADDGIDFAHPDLHGTWATVADPASPYYGWPMMFDSFSMLLLALDQHNGTHYVANVSPGCMYAATTLACSGATFSFQPKGGTNHVYTLPGTSQSGTYYIGNHPDYRLAYLNPASANENVAVLVADENSAGVYDTVYVDLNYNYVFDAIEKFNKANPAVRLDMTGDGYADLNGGLLYFIADGVHPVPASDWYWGLTAPPNGTLVCFATCSAEGSFYSHGTQCASGVAGQGVIDGTPAEAGAYRPDFKTPGTGVPGSGMVVGGGKHARLVSCGNIYFNYNSEDALWFALLGYDGVYGSTDDVQIISCSFGESTVDNDGWDDKSYMFERIVRNTTLSVCKSTGNGGPGYGTVCPPSPASAIAVGASTEYGSTGWDSPGSAQQITYGDVTPFSNRGPGARGNASVDVVAGGAYSAGDVNLNDAWYQGLNGWTAWGTWGGTSRSAPVAAGNLALVYDAYRQKHGVWPDNATARAIFMAGATDLHYDPLTMGAGMVDADRATDVAGGSAAVYATPPSWSAGAYRGTNYPAFASITFPGQTCTQAFAVVNPGGTVAMVDLRTKVLVKTGTKKIKWKSKDYTIESPYDFYKRPDYLINITKYIPDGTDLLVIKAIYPYAQMDPNNDYNTDNRWYLVPYDWTDVNGNGVLWHDFNDNGVVNTGEIENNEYVRFSYHRPKANSLQHPIQRPLERMHTGIFIGLMHATRSALVKQTSIKFVLEFYRFKPWKWVNVSAAGLNVPAGLTGIFNTVVAVPKKTPPGLYQGAIEYTEGGHVSTIPVTVNVAARYHGAPLKLAGTKAARFNKKDRYNNGVVEGCQDWSWRAEAGDWRFFFIDVTNAPAGGKLLAINKWKDAAPHTDNDTLIYGPADFPASITSTPAYAEYFGPYSMRLKGKSPNRNTTGGVWLFNTSTGRGEDWVSAPLQNGLHEIMVHNVLFEGDVVSAPYEITLGGFSVTPAELVITSTAANIAFNLTINSSVKLLGGVRIEASGLSPPATNMPDRAITQGAWQSFPVTIATNGGLIEARTAGGTAPDVDLSLYDPADTLVSKSSGGTSSEYVATPRPVSGTWNVRVYCFGFSGTYNLEVRAVQGADIKLMNKVKIKPGKDAIATFNVAVNVPGTYSGQVMIGPASSPGIVTVPVQIIKQ